MNENITRNEILNDGKTIHLYFNGMIGLYVAYGISAYLLCKYAKAKTSYSVEQFHLAKNVSNYRCLAVNIVADMGEYTEWASALRSEGGY